jgi:hypothetical protein
VLSNLVLSILVLSNLVLSNLVLSNLVLLNLVLLNYVLSNYTHALKPHGELKLVSLSAEEICFVIVNEFLVVVSKVVLIVAERGELCVGILE